MSLDDERVRTEEALVARGYSYVQERDEWVSHRSRESHPKTWRINAEYLRPGSQVRRFGLLDYLIDFEDSWRAT